VIDGKVQGFSSPGRSNLPAGEHTIDMQLDGYRSWEKDITLGAGQLLWLNYVRLIPTSVTTTPLKTFAQFNKLLASPDKRWVMLQEAANQPTMTLMDIGNENQPVYTTLTLPDNQISKPAGTFTVTEWDLGSRYLLIHHVAAGIDEWLRADRAQPDKTVNISRLFGLSIADTHFSGSNPDVLYARTDTVLRRLDVGAKSASAALVSGVTYFTVYGNGTIAFVAEREATVGNPASRQQMVGIYKQDTESVVQAVPLGVRVTIAYGEYDNHMYLAIRKASEPIQILRDPSTAAAKDTTLFASVLISAALDQLSFSNNTRMLVARTDTTMTTYDLELAKVYSRTLSYLQNQPNRNLLWLDDYYLWSDAGERLRIVEFDGQNDRELTSVAPGFAVTLSPTGKTLYSIGKNAITGNYFLQASQLVIP
jgi:hypothetical protein